MPRIATPETSAEKLARWRLVRRTVAYARRPDCVLPHLSRYLALRRANITTRVAVASGEGAAIVTTHLCSA